MPGGHSCLNSICQEFADAVVGDGAAQVMASAADP